MTKFLLATAIVLLHFTFMVPCKVNCNTTEETLLFDKDYNTIVSLSIGYPIPGKSYTFFETFSKYFGSEENTVKSIPNITFAFKGEFIEGYRFGILAEFYRNYYSEYYVQPYEDSFQKGNRYLNQEINIDNFPLLVIAELVPYSLPYKSYVGLGMGVNISKISWKEELSSDFDDDLRKGGSHFQESLLSPTIRLYSGLELRFDRHSVSSFINSLVLEIAANYSFSNLEFYKGVQDQFKTATDELEQSYSIVPYSIFINLGLTLNFDPLKKQIKNS